MTFEVGMFGTKLHFVSKNPNVCIHTLEKGGGGLKFLHKEIGGNEFFILITILN